jgi:hypothetical protein
VTPRFKTKGINNMANANTLAGFSGSGTLRNQFPTQTVATATETALVVGTDTGTATALITLPTGGQVYGASAGLDINANQAITDRSNYIYGLPSGESNDQFNSGSWTARAFKIRLSGTASLGATQTAIFYLYNGAATVVGTAGNRIASTGAAFPSGGTSTTPSNFWLEFTGLWDPTLQTVSGFYSSNVANGSTSQIVAPTVITNVQTSVAASGLTFCAGVKLANTTSSTISVSEFVIERV